LSRGRVRLRGLGIREADVSNAQLAIAASTIWVLLAAILVIFMQAGFSFLESGLTRMKNVGHIAAKNVLIFAIASIVYFAVGFGIAFGDGGNGIVGGSGFFPAWEALVAVGAEPFSWFSTVPAGAALLFQVAFAGVSLAIVWGAMAERTKLWVYFAFGVVFTLVYSVVSHWIWSPDGWLFGRGMQDFAGSTVVHYQGALAALAGALLLGPRIGKFGSDGKPNAIPGHNIAFTTLGVLILWIGWFGFNAGSTLSVSTGETVGFFGYVAVTTNLGAAAGVVGAVVVSWLVIGKPDLSMMLNGAIAALVAITAACAFVAPWAALVIGFVAGAIAVLGILLVERAGIDDPIGALSVHGMAGVWGTLATGLFAVPALAEKLATGTGGFVYTGSLDQVGTQALGLLAVGAFTFGASFLALWTMKATFGIRVEPQVEAAGLDVSEHGMWGYPEFYIPVPGGYGTEHHHAHDHGHGVTAPSGSAAAPATG
jgi:Amt family ammonium transporter